MEKQHLTAHFMQSKRIALLWVGLLAGPLAWALQLGISYMLVPYLCGRSNGGLVLHLLTLAMLLLAIAGVWLSWRSWDTAGANWPGDEAGPMGRSRFMATSGIILSGFFALVILAQWIPIMLLDPCAI